MFNIKKIKKKKKKIKKRYKMGIKQAYSFIKKIKVFRLILQKKKKKNYGKVLTFSAVCGILCMSDGDGQNPPPTEADSVGKPHNPRAKGRATADKDGRWGVAAGILNTKGCGEAGNP